MKMFEIKDLHNQICHFFLIRSLVVVIRLEEINFGNFTNFAKLSGITVCKNTVKNFSICLFVALCVICMNPLFNCLELWYFYVVQHSLFLIFLLNAHTSPIYSQPLRTIII